MTASFECWDLTAPVVPPRSRFYPLKPIGIGTPLVESLTSYLLRRAEAHTVPVGTLTDELQRCGAVTLPGTTGPRTSCTFPYPLFSYSVNGVE